jgi:hypothetical protein
MGRGGDELTRTRLGEELVELGMHGGVLSFADNSR